LEKQVETLDQHGEIENKVIASRELRIEVSWRKNLRRNTTDEMVRLGACK
jgi:hypothetical protein